MSSTHEDTPWVAELWGRWYRGVYIHVEETYNHDPAWTWNVEGDDEEHRASTKLEAQQAAERFVDARLDEVRP